MSWREVYLCPIVAMQAAMKGKDEEDRMAWSLTRWKAFMDARLSPFIKPFDKPASPVQFYRFPWEAEEKPAHDPVTLTEDQVAELFRITSALAENKMC